ncbi:hypothetical protein PYCC9005_002582 [Savitreella phatthalungensis]
MPSARHLSTQRYTRSSLDLPPSMMSDEPFFGRRPDAPRGDNSNSKDPNDIGRTLRILSNKLPSLLQDGTLPSSILSENITLELLPSTLGLPDIRGKTAYSAFTRLSTWSVRQVWPESRLMVDSHRLHGSGRKLERLIVRFRVVQPRSRTARHGHGDAYTGLFHFYFDSQGLISRHIFEITDERWTPGEVLNSLLGRRRDHTPSVAGAGLCCRSYYKPAS